jgi:hypothetical protein
VKQGIDAVPQDWLPPARPGFTTRAKGQAALAVLLHHVAHSDAAHMFVKRKTLPSVSTLEATSHVKLYLIRDYCQIFML